jgi:beta-lactam-binding protein with PASTA domain/tRNA A-37 threonylcarbamoyl transferase component Bud32
MDTTLSDPLVGRSLEGRYAVEAFIAHGGMATVYLATDTKLERRVAVKILHAHLADDAETVARFEREARAAARLSHPDVVTVYDQGVDHGRPYLVMEYVPGANLRRIIRDRGRLSAAEAVAVMDHVLAALAAAHAAGLVHRDVKPENVLVTADGRVKVADFGLARAVAGTTVTTTSSVLMGTAQYLAPEQFEHGTADERSDVFSAGVLFYELLTGSAPFAADNTYALLTRYTKEDIPPPSAAASGVPPQVDALVTWATSRDPQQRPADAGELHASLVDVRDRLGLHAAVPAPPIAMTTRIFEPDHTAVLPAVGAPVTDQTRVVGPPRPPVAARPAGAAARPPKRRRRGLIISAIVTVLAIVAAVLGWWFAAGRYTNAPDVKGLTKAQATAKLEHAGYHARFLPSIYTTDFERGVVADERHNSHVTHGATVDLRLSLGGRPHTLPDYQGETVQAVTASLASWNIGVSSSKKVFSLDVKKGFVVATVPGPNSVVTEGKKVALEVSKGPQRVPVPDVQGLSQQDATDALQAKGFTVTPVQRYSSTVASGTAITTHPTAGKHPVKGSTITLVVSQGPRLYPVPNVEGESLNQAIHDINSAGFQANPHELFPGGPGTVDHQDPQGGSMQQHGTTITLDYY